MWTPASGTRALAEHFGTDQAFKLLTRLLAGEVRQEDLGVSPYAEVLRFIGRSSDPAFFEGDKGKPHIYWSRVWAARAMAYLGDDSTAPWLHDALRDSHWRVRMTAAQTLGRLHIEGYEEALTQHLSDSHPRVRAAVAKALGLTGNEFALVPLQDALDDADEVVRARADRALARVEKRIGRVD